MLPLCLILSADFDYVSALQRGLKSHGLKLYGIADVASLTPILAQWRFDAFLCDADGSTSGGNYVVVDMRLVEVADQGDERF